MPLFLRHQYTPIMAIMTQQKIYVNSKAQRGQIKVQVRYQEPHPLNSYLGSRRWSIPHERATGETQCPPD